MTKFIKMKKLLKKGNLYLQPNGVWKEDKENALEVTSEQAWDYMRAFKEVNCDMVYHFPECSRYDFSIPISNYSSMGDD